MRLQAHELGGQPMPRLLIALVQAVNEQANSLAFDEARKLTDEIPETLI